jgi:hypothetical protein
VKEQEDQQLQLQKAEYKELRATSQLYKAKIAKEKKNK